MNALYMKGSLTKAFTNSFDLALFLHFNAEEWRIYSDKEALL